MNDKSYQLGQFNPDNEPTNRQPTGLPNLHPRQPITCHKLPKTTQIVPYKPQTHENHTDRLQTLADSHPQGVRELHQARPLRNHPPMEGQLHPARTYHPSQKRLTMEWIKCSERMPTGNDPVLVYIRDGYQIIAFKEKTHWVWEGESWFLSEGIYWMPLPPNPF